MVVQDCDIRLEPGYINFENMYDCTTYVTIGMVLYL